MAIFTAIAYAVAYAGAYLAAAAGISIATATTIGVAIGSAAAAIATSVVSRLLQPKISIPQSEIQAVINQTDAPRRVYVGNYLAGGIRAFFDVKDGALYQLVVVSHGEISGFAKFWVDGVPAEIDANGDVIGTNESVSFPIGIQIDLGYLMNVQTRTGAALGGDYADLISAFTNWTNARQLTNQATFLVQMKAPKAEDFSKVYPKSYNTSLQWEIKGQEVYDPRTGLTVYGSNAALVIAHYLTHPDGFKLNTADIHWNSVSSMADVSGELVPQLSGPDERRLRLWGYWTMDENPVDVLGRMHGSSGIRAYEMQDGRIGLIGGSFGTPSCTITAKDIKQIQTSEAISEREGYNVLRVFHLDATQKYEVTEVDPWTDAARIAVEGEIVKEYRLEMCPNRSQARRLAKQQIHNDNRAKVEIITNLVGLKARFPKSNGQRHTINLDYRPEDGSGRVIQGEYEVMDHEFDPVGLECRIELHKVDRASDTWTPAEEGQATTPLPSPDANPAPAISAVLTQRVIQASASSQIAVLEVDAVAIAGRADLQIQARYRKVGSTKWTDMTATDYTAQSGAVEDGSAYEAQARFDGIFDEPDTWEDLGSVTVQIDGTAPGQPTELIPSNGTGKVHLSWRNPTGSFFNLRIYRNTTADFGSAALVGTTGGAAGQISEFSDSTVAATTNYNFWVAAANVSGVEGTPAGPANITTT